MVAPSKGKDYWVGELYKGIDVKAFRKFNFDRLHVLLVILVAVLFFIIFADQMKLESTVFELQHKYELQLTQAVKTAETNLKWKNMAEIERDNWRAQSERLKNRINELEAIAERSEKDITDYILMVNSKTPKVVAQEIAKNVLRKSEEHNVPFVATLAIIQVESHFNPYAVSNLKKDPARGLMQVRPGVWNKQLGIKNRNDLHDIEIGIDAGCSVLRIYLDQTDNNMKKALYKYVGGSEVYGKKVYESMGKFVVFRAFVD
jgi:soluble lytic murein transglycosylase-like protein